MMESSLDKKYDDEWDDDDVDDDDVDYVDGDVYDEDDYSNQYFQTNNHLQHKRRRKINNHLGNIWSMFHLHQVC